MESESTSPPRYSSLLEGHTWAYADVAWDGRVIDRLVVRKPLSEPLRQWTALRHQVHSGGLVIFDLVACPELRRAAHAIVRARLASDLTGGVGYCVVKRRGCCGG